MGCKQKEGCILRDDLTAVPDELKTADGLISGSPTDFLNFIILQ
jgi:multimeric flavodoxin WrbA